ncbi:MAG: hypothetical protein U0401_19250 [Anaerolineae bacterium]
MATTIWQVLIVENKLLLGGGIERLLAGESHLNIVGITPSDETSLIDMINHLQPDVIILDQATPLTNSVRLLTCLKDYPRVRLVGVSADDNLVQVHDKQQIQVSEATDLAAIIQQGFEAVQRET